jgi:hypothetical protein
MIWCLTKQKLFKPFKVDNAPQLGTLHIRHNPDHEPVATRLQSGEKEHCEIGRSSPI